MDKRIKSRPDVNLENTFLQSLNEKLSPTLYISLLSKDTGEYEKILRFEKFLEKGNLYFDAPLTDIKTLFPFIYSLYKRKGCLHILPKNCMSELSYNIQGVHVMKEGINSTLKIPMKIDEKTTLKQISSYVEETSFKVHFKSRINEFRGWDFLYKLNFPINSVIYIDRYSFRSEDQINENFKQIFISLLKCCNEKIFNFTILTDQSSIPKDRLRKLVEVFFSEIEGSKNLNLSLFYLPTIKMTHDRKILTNYFMISSGNSFNYYDNNRINVDTRLTLTPIFYRNDLYKELQSIKEELIYRNLQKQLTNPLFSIC